MNPDPEPVVILGVLQNQWFADPERVRRMIADGEQRWPGVYRRRLIATMLFTTGCKTGLVLRRVFGDWCDRIVWEESSLEIGGHAASFYPPDIRHLQSCLNKLQPRLVLGFGNVACCALTPLCSERLIVAPHPAARGGDVLRKLHAARTELESYF